MCEKIEKLGTQGKKSQIKGSPLSQMDLIINLAFEKKKKRNSLNFAVNKHPLNMTF